MEKKIKGTRKKWRHWISVHAEKLESWKAENTESWKHYIA